jgi:ubiquinol-cytochrome c reductase cytochrome c1 subunit
MVRILGILVGFGFVGVAAWSLLWGAITYLQEPPKETVEYRFHHHARDIAYSFDGPFGRYDRRQLQRGLQVYQQVCSSCHSLQYIAFRNFRDLGYTEAEVRALADQWRPRTPSIGPDGSAAERNAVPADRIPSPYPNEAAARNANNNALPPDLSLITKAREGGPAYVESLLTGYHSPPADLPRDSRPGPNLHYNPYFANLNIAMPPPLRPGLVTYADGTNATPAQMAHDVSAFLAWTAEPHADARKNMGIVALIFLLMGTILAYMAYQNVWAGRKH